MYRYTYTHVISNLYKMKIRKKKSVNWSIAVHDELGRFDWIPIFSIQFSDDYTRNFGLTSDGHWVNEIIMGESINYSITKNKSQYLWIITVLEKERNYIENILTSGLEKNTDGGYTKEIFPFLDLIKFALWNDRGSWAKKALKWLRQEEFDEELSGITKDFVDKKLMDQTTRHHLFKMMKRYERSKADNRH